MAADRSTSRRGSRKDNYRHPIPSRIAIIEALESAPGPLPFDALLNRLKVSGEQPRRGMENRLKAMVRDGQLIRNRAREYCLTGHLDLVSGVVSAHRDGFGFLSPDAGDEDIYLSAREMRPLWNGDRVAVRVSRGKKGLDGHVVEILERNRTEIVGRLERERGVDFVTEAGQTTTEILIGRGHRGRAKPGDTVRVEVLEYPTHRGPAIGRIVEIIGRPGDTGIETDVAILAHGIPDQWPGELIAEAEAFPDTVPAGAKRGREDLRSLPLVTIDGADARDFDDAVYCERTTAGFRLVVAIADVAHYVRPDTALDAQAQLRGTSVYFPDRVVPMLPEALSNGLCSLNPKVDRLCMVCEMHVSEAGKVTRSRFFNAVMRSSARLTYSRAWQLLSEKPASAADRALRETLEPLQAVYRAFAKARRNRGAIDFEFPETKIRLGDDGQVERMHPLERLESHRIIEECMIAANVEAAKQLAKTRMPALYRIHEAPKEEKIEELWPFLRTFDIALPPPDNIRPKDFSRILDTLAHRPEVEIVRMMVLRSMNQAKYQPTNVGHFGLALSQYAHFTSPIRRYPDLLVHRALKWHIEHGSFKGYGYSMQEMTRLGEQTSRCERRADEAVWDVEEQLKCAFMRERIGEEFDAQISSIVPFGAFVRIPEFGIDGLVHVSALPRDYYHRNSSGTALVGERSGRRFALMDALRVRVSGVSLEERKIDFVPVADANSRERRGG
ncbi:MAG: ribonuclease R [Gammaproteobacteria bacterium]|jgi:ribonuclease R